MSDFHWTGIQKGWNTAIVTDHHPSTDFPTLSPQPWRGCEGVDNRCSVRQSESVSVNVPSFKPPLLATPSPAALVVSAVRARPRIPQLRNCIAALLTIPIWTRPANKRAAMFLISHLASLIRQAGTNATESLIIPPTLMHVCLSNSRPATDRQPGRAKIWAGPKFARFHCPTARCTLQRKKQVRHHAAIPLVQRNRAQTALAIARGWQARSGLVGRHGTYIDTEPRRAGKAGEKGCPNVKKASWDPRIPACPFGRRRCG